MFCFSGNARKLMAISVILSGCGGGSVAVFNPGPNGLPFAQTGASTAELLSTYLGIEFDVQASAAETDKSGASPYTNSSETQNLKIKVVSATQIDVTVGGTTIPLTATGTGTQSGVDGTLFTNAANGITALFGRADQDTQLQSIIFGYIDQTTPSVESDTFIIGGFQTDPAEITARSDTATYTGLAHMAMRETNGTAATTSQTVLSDVSGTNITVNFGAGNNQITGYITGSGDYAGGAVRFDLAPASITAGNTFSTTFSKSTGLTGIAVSGTELSGVFYGKDAGEIAGSFSAELSAGGVLVEQAAGSGFFLGSE